jgi:hypothetical protein
MGHLGLTPQSIYKFGTYVVRAREEEEAERLKRDAKLLEEAGCFALVLEKIPAKLAAEVAKSVSIPVIGIGAGGRCGRPGAGAARHAGHQQGVQSPFPAPIRRPAHRCHRMSSMRTAR